MSVQLLIAFAIFTALALFAPAAVESLTSRYRLRRPHRALLLVFRAWFALLAAATLWLLLHPAPAR